MNHVEQVPYDTTTRPAAEVVHLIQRQVERMRNRVNRADRDRETRVRLLAALRTIRPERGV